MNKARNIIIAAVFFLSAISVAFAKDNTTTGTGTVNVTVVEPLTINFNKNPNFNHSVIGSEFGLSSSRLLSTMDGMYIEYSVLGLKGMNVTLSNNGTDYGIGLVTSSQGKTYIRCRFKEILTVVNSQSGNSETFLTLTAACKY
jgi:hypothetical protein